VVTFEEHVRRAPDGLPGEIVRDLRNIAVVVEDESAEEPDLYGLFQESEHRLNELGYG